MTNTFGNNTDIKTGFSNIDTITGGLKRKDLIVVASRPGIGKTTFAINLAYNFCNNNYTVAYFTLESSGTQFVKKTISCISKVSIKNIVSGNVDDEQHKDIVDYATKLIDKQLYICDKANLTIVDFENKCKELKKNNGLDVAIIDYLQLLSLGKVEEVDTTNISSRKYEIDYLLRRLKVIARELDIAIIVTSQMHRSSELNGNPQASDFRESSRVEQYADVIFLMSVNKDSPNNMKTMDIIVAKNTNGETGVVGLKFDKSTYSFNELHQ